MSYVSSLAPMTSTFLDNLNGLIKTIYPYNVSYEILDIPTHPKNDKQPQINK